MNSLEVIKKIEHDYGLDLPDYTGNTNLLLNPANKALNRGHFI